MYNNLKLKSLYSLPRDLSPIVTQNSQRRQNLAKNILPSRSKSPTCPEIEKLKQYYKSSSRPSYRSRSSIKIRERTSTLKYQQQEMPAELAVMNHVRQGVLQEVFTNNKQITVEELDNMRKNLTPTFVEKLKEAQVHYQKVTKRRELISRSPLSNARYGIAALSRKKPLLSHISNNFPKGSRFNLKMLD